MVVPVVAAGLLAACGGSTGLGNLVGPSFYRRLESQSVKVDEAAALGLFSNYRISNRLGPLRLDPRLTAIAERQAKAMAERDEVSHSLAGAFSARMSDGGYEADLAVENIGAGYRTLAEAFSGWRDSPGHRANMLRDGVTEMGIAGHAPQSKYKVFWSLVLAKPHEGPPGPPIPR